MNCHARTKQKVFNLKQKSTVNIVRRSPISRINMVSKPPSHVWKQTVFYQTLDKTKFSKIFSNPFFFGNNVLNRLISINIL